MIDEPAACLNMSAVFPRKEGIMSIVIMGSKRPSWTFPAAVLLILFSLFVTVLAGSSDAQAAGRRPGHVYLYRGLLNVFSLGMDSLASKLEAVGVASSVSNHTLWSGEADAMIAKWQAGNHEPIILMGHSAGADATISVARKLAQYKIPVALIINFDPVSPDPVPSNVKQIVNYYVPAGWGQAVSADKSFKGKLANMNENAITNHFSIDKDDSLHRQAIARVLAVTGGGIRRKPAGPKPAQVSAAPQQ
jgi:pimeloyl-ACP methyl ester carboxylesterase